MNIINKGILNELEAHIPHEKFVRNIQTFMTHLPAQIIELETLVHTADLKSVAGMAHMLKGTCGQFGAMRLQEIFKSIEFCAEQHRLQDVRAMVHVLPYEYQLVHELMDLAYKIPPPPQMPCFHSDTP